MTVELPPSALILLVGPAGAGKSTFAGRHFRPTEVLSSDYCRALVSDDPNNQAATEDAFELLHFIAAKRLHRHRLTVVDATNVRPRARRPLLDLARHFDAPTIAIVFDLPLELCESRNHARPERTVGPFAIARQLAQLHHSLPKLAQEGFAQIITLHSQSEVDALKVHRPPTTDN
jgi:protein phosphatase